MLESERHVCTRRWIAIAIFIAPLCHWGCSTPTAPLPPPAGGATATLSFEDFDAAVEPVLERHGCDATGDCHGGGIRGSLALSPPDAKDARFDFDQVALQVSPTAPEASPILTKPLAAAAGGTPHSVEPFASVDDPDYQAILAWIRAGTAP